MHPVGLITFHSAYNFGSVLQAYATQRTIDDILGDNSCQIVNYRLTEQKRYYCDLYRTKYGVKTFIKDLMQLPVSKQRKLRAQRFEDFMATHMNLSAECAEPAEVAALWQGYQTMVSGSDQILNKHALELQQASWDYMDPYVLKGFTGKKVSYASSIGGMTDDELDRLIPALSEFDHLAARERKGANAMSKKMGGRDIPVVLDPTLLLDKDRWLKTLGIPDSSKGAYVLYYSLQGIKPLMAAVPVLERLAGRLGVGKVVIVNPNVHLRQKSDMVELGSDYGPIEFLKAVLDARAVVTDSYHGTAFAANFGRDVYSICFGNAADYRKSELLERIGLESRVISNVGELDNMSIDEPFDRDQIQANIETHRQKSLEYLRTALA